EVASRVGDEADLQILGSQQVEHWKRVLVELEVRRVLPGARHLDGAFVGGVGVAAHAPNDPLGERDPDLLVVLELRVAADALDRLLAGCCVARGIEVEGEALAETAVPLRPELRPWPRDREVDVEEDRAEAHSRSRRRDSRHLRSLISSVAPTLMSPPAATA